MATRIVARLHGEQWIRPLEIFQDAQIEEIVIQPGVPDSASMVKKFVHAHEMLLQALQHRALVAEINADGHRVAVSSTYWQSGSGVRGIRDGRIVFTGGAPESFTATEGCAFFVDETRFEAWLSRIEKGIAEAKRPSKPELWLAKDSAGGIDANTRPEVDQGSPVQLDEKPRKREERRKITAQKHGNWYKLALQYGHADDGKKRTREQIAKKVATDPSAKDPETEKAPDSQTVKRRLDRDYPGWAEKSWAQKKGTKILPAPTP